MPNEAERDARIARWAGVGVFLGTTGTAVALAAPAAHWLDASEFAATAFQLGNAHPPGHPLPVLLGKAATLVPLGGIAFRVNCASAVALGVAAVLLLYAIHRTIRLCWAALEPGDRPLRPAVIWPVAVCGALGLVLGPAALYQGVRAEVYALNLAINLGLVHLSLRYLDRGSGRDLALAGLVAGLGMGNHHLLTLAASPAVLAAALVRHDGWRVTGRRLGVAVGAGIVGMLVLLQLPARSTAHPAINWGAPHTFERFVWTVSARLFQRTARTSVKQSPGEHAGRLVVATADELGAGIGLAALAGLVLLGLRRKTRGLLVVLGLAALGTAIAALLAAFDPLNPDSQGYVLLLFAVGALLAATTLAVALSYLRLPTLPRALPVIIAVSTVVWPAQALAGSLPRADLRQAYGAEVAAETLLDEAPQHALILTSYYQTGFAVWAARLLGGARPDLDHVHRTFLAQPGFIENQLAREPHLTPLLAGVRGPADLNGARLAPVLHHRAVLYEFDDDTYDAEMIRDSVPDGLWRRLVLPDDPRARVEQDARDARRVWKDLERRLAPDRGDPLTRMWLLWAYYLDARYYVRRNDCAAARFGWARASALGNPNDPMLLRLQRRCGF